jgi:hypothetical protein
MVFDKREFVLTRENQGNVENYLKVLKGKLAEIRNTTVALEEMGDHVADQQVLLV